MARLVKVCFWGSHLDLGKVPLSLLRDKLDRICDRDEIRRCVIVCNPSDNICDTHEFCNYCRGRDRSLCDTKNKSENETIHIISFLKKILCTIGTCAFSLSDQCPFSEKLHE